MAAPFLSVVTRCHPDRPGFLANNMASLSRQSDQDYEHLFIADDLGRGIEWANQALQTATPTGDYVLILDDDDMLSDGQAIDKLRRAATGSPDVVVFKADHDFLGILPRNMVWCNRPIQGMIGSCDFITRRDVWYDHIHEFGTPKCGDYAFLKAVWQTGPDVVWLDEKLAAVQRISNGRPE